MSASAPTVTIGFPLEAHLVERIRDSGVAREVLFDEAFVGTARYPNDHSGTPVTFDADLTRRWHAMLARTDVLFGYPGESSAALAAALRDGPRIAFVQGTSAGMGAHVKRAALPPETLERIRFASAAGVHAPMLAEFVFHGLLALRKDARRLHELRERRQWEHFVMGELDGSALAIVGMGQIGAAIATRARAFGMRVIAVTRTGAAHPLADETHATSAIASVMGRCDATVVTLPLTDLTNGLVDRRAIEAMPAHAILANVGRGAVVDNAALLEALEAGRIRGAVLDVFDPEPLPADSPFWYLPNVVFSPHTAALAERENERIVDIFCENLERFAAGRPLRNAVNVIEFY